jgi:hypothetical protein
MNYELASSLVVVNPLGRPDALLLEIFPCARLSRRSRASLRWRERLSDSTSIYVSAATVFGKLVASRLLATGRAPAALRDEIDRDRALEDRDRGELRSDEREQRDLADLSERLRSRPQRHALSGAARQPAAIGSRSALSTVFAAGRKRGREANSRTSVDHPVHDCGPDVPLMVAFVGQKRDSEGSRPGLGAIQEPPASLTRASPRTS